MKKYDQETIDRLSDKELKDTYLDAITKLNLNVYIQLRALGCSQEEILEELSKDPKLRKFAKDGFEIIEDKGQLLILNRKIEISKNKLFDECISWLEEDIRHLNQMLLSIDHEKEGAKYSNLTEKEKAYLKIEIMKTKNTKIKTLIKYKYEK